MEQVPEGPRSDPGLREHLREDGQQEPQDIPTQPLPVTLEDDGVRQDTLSLSSGCEGPMCKFNSNLFS